MKIILTQPSHYNSIQTARDWPSGVNAWSERSERNKWTTRDEVSATNVNDARRDIMSNMGARNAGVCFLYENYTDITKSL